MNLLGDEQLPPALAQWFCEQGCTAVHVREVGLAHGKDLPVWNKAVSLHAAVVTKDEDFVEMTRFRKEKVPIVWLRIGNCTNRVLLSWFVPIWPAIRQRLESGELLIEVRR